MGQKRMIAWNDHNSSYRHAIASGSNVKLNTVSVLQASIRLGYRSDFLDYPTDGDWKNRTGDLDFHSAYHSPVKELGKHWSQVVGRTVKFFDSNKFIYACGSHLIKKNRIVFEIKWFWLAMYVASTSTYTWHVDSVTLDYYATVVLS